jgi:hypothetical protein
MSTSPSPSTPILPNIPQPALTLAPAPALVTSTLVPQSGLTPTSVLPNIPQPVAPNLTTYANLISPAIAPTISTNNAPAVVINNKDEEKPGLSTFQIIMISLFSFIVLVAIIGIIYYAIKSKNNNTTATYGGKKPKMNLKKFKMKGGCGCSAMGVY